MANNVQNSHFSFARIFILVENMLFRTSQLTRRGGTLQRKSVPFSAKSVNFEPEKAERKYN
jgi:hypothetical protein